MRHALQPCMNKLARPLPIPGLDTPGKLDMIVQELFPRHPMRIPEKWPPSCSHEAAVAKIEISELVYAAHALKKNNAPGPDGITNDVLQCFVRSRPEIFLKAFNKCLTKGTFPAAWKTARLVLLRKGDKPLDVASSYRPLSILDCSGKLFEKILDNRLRIFIEENEVLSHAKFGFRKGRSTTDTVSALRNIVEAHGSRKKVGVLTLNVKNAFNSAPWEAILNAMPSKNIPMYICRIMGSYLENRKLRIYSKGSIKEEVLSSGVLQGSVLGPTLWNLLYNSLLQNHLPTEVSVLAFTDDVALVAVANNVHALGETLTSAAETTRG